MAKKNIKSVSGVSTEAPPTPGNQSPGDSFCPQTIAEVLTDLNKIFDNHHRKYKSGLEWRKAIIENLAAWRLGIKNGK